MFIQRQKPFVHTPFRQAAFYLRLVGMKIKFYLHRIYANPHVAYKGIKKVTFSIFPRDEILHRTGTAYKIRREQDDGNLTVFVLKSTHRSETFLTLTHRTSNSLFRTKREIKITCYLRIFSSRGGGGGVLFIKDLCQNLGAFYIQRISGGRGGLFVLNLKKSYVWLR